MYKKAVNRPSDETYNSIDFTTKKRIIIIRWNSKL